jgi:putative transposase
MKRSDGGVIAGTPRSRVCRQSKNQANGNCERRAIEVLLTDEQRPGAPATFTFEQFMQSMALACETPEASDRPVSTWTPHELADEASKRGIVPTISARTLERFLKGECVAAPPQTLLAHPTCR